MDRSRQNRRMPVGAAMAGSVGLGIGIGLWWPTFAAAALVIVVAYVVRYR